jgi:hypothetical protein
MDGKVFRIEDVTVPLPSGFGCRCQYFSLSTLAAGLVFLGGSIVILANAGLLPDRWLVIGTAIGTIGSMAIGILTGRDSQHLGESQR